MSRSYTILFGQFIIGLTLMAFTGPALAEDQQQSLPWWVWILIILILLLLLVWWWASNRPRPQGQAEAEAAPSTMKNEAEAEEALSAAEGEAEDETVTEAEPAPAPPPPDDLKRIEGIGPKIAGLLRDHGITTFAQLAETEVTRLRQILDEAPFRAPTDPTTWPEQARLAAQGDWEALAGLQDELQGGRRV